MDLIIKIDESDVADIKKNLDVSSQLMLIQMNF